MATTKGYYALGPGISEKGDFIAVLCGTRGPVVLRESTSKKGSYKIIGEKFVVSKRTYHNTQGVLLPKRLGGIGTQDWEGWGAKANGVLLI